MTLMTLTDPNFDPNGNAYISTKNQVLGLKGQIFVYLLYVCVYTCIKINLIFLSCVLNKKK